MTTTAINEKPILFSGLMVRAILEGRKSQTRRVVKPNPDISGHWKEWTPERTDHWIRMCPYGKPGDRLWVRETWGDMALPGYGPVIAYRADPDEPEKGMGLPPGMKWKPSIHMPRYFSRLTLEITEVRVQRVQEISEEDAKAEGIYRGTNGLYANYPQGETVPGWSDPRKSFQSLWDSINSKRGFGWEKNPFVWAISFKRIQEFPGERERAQGK